MKIRIRSALAGAAALAVVGGILVGGGASAFAAATPGWEPDDQALGTVTFYDANGNQVTSGKVDAHPFTVYAVTSGPGRPGDTKALLQLFTPTPGVNPGNWQMGDQLTATTDYPPAGLPASIAALGDRAIASGAPTDLSLGDFIGEFPNTLTDPAYQNMYEVRVKTSAPGVGPDLKYFRADIQVDPVAGTWQVVYPAPATATQTTVTASPSSPQPPNTPVTLTATVASVPPGAGSIAGSVEFFDGTTSIGTGAYNASTGKATLALTPASGSHQYTAKFTPTDTTAFSGSTSAALTFNVGSPTSIALSANPPSPATSDTAINVTLTGTVAPTGVAGTVSFFDGSTNLGAADSYTPATGVTTKVVSLATGNHLITASFAPSDPTYAGSTSAIMSYDVAGTNSKPVTINAPDNTPPYSGNLNLVVSNTTVTLSQVDPSTAAGHPVVATDATGHRHAWVFDGNLSGVSVTDTRPSQPGWTLTGQASNFVNGSTVVSSDNFGWTPALTGGDAEGAVIAGAPVNPKFQTASSAGLTSPSNLATTAAGNGWGTKNLSADLALWIPDTSSIGTYSSTLTLTLVSP